MVINCKYIGHGILLGIAKSRNSQIKNVEEVLKPMKNDDSFR